MMNNMNWNIIADRLTLRHDKHKTVNFFTKEYKQFFGDNLDTNISLLKTNGSLKPHVDPKEFVGDIYLTMVKILHVNDLFYFEVNGYKSDIVEGKTYFLNPNVLHAVLKHGCEKGLSVGGNVIMALYDFKFNGDVSNGIDIYELKYATEQLDKIYNKFK